MKKNIVSVLAVITVIPIIILLILGTRQSIKATLPREGEVERVGGVYTPYLLLDSTLYFLKYWDESLDLAFAKSFTEKAKIEMNFANKRLLEMEKLSREGNSTYRSILSDSFLSSLQQTVTLTQEAAKSGENIEGLVWTIQESAQDQQQIFTKIINELPLEKKGDIAKLQEQSRAEIGKLLQIIYGFE